MTPTSTPLALDHVVIVVTDLDESAARLEDLGFYVTVRSDHPFGTSNRIVMLDDTYLELVTVTDPSRLPATGFARYIDDALNSGRLGPRLIAFRSEDPAADHSRMASQGLNVAAPLHFGRDAVLADGSAVPVEFVVVLPDFEGVTVGSFVCHHLTPEMVWHPSIRRHPNGAAQVMRVGLEHAEPAVWELMGRVSATSGPPMELGATTVEDGSSTIVVTGQTGGSAIIDGTTVTVEQSAPAS